MKIKLCKRNGGWLLLIFLAIVVVIVVGVILVGLLQMCKKIDKPEDRDRAVNEAWTNAIVFAEEFARTNGCAEILNNHMVEQTPAGYGILTYSTDGANWKTNNEAALSSIEAANEWQSNWQANTPPMTNAAMFYRVLIVVTNTP